jgi:hypothetical protein
MLPRLSFAPVRLPPGYKLLPQEVVFLCCISQGTRPFSWRQYYQPTFPILLTNPPRYLRLTLSPVPPSSHTRTFTFAHNLFTSSLMNLFIKTLYSTFSPSSMLCVSLFYFFLHFLTFPSTTFIVFIFLHISPCGLFNPIVWTLVTLYHFAFLT